MRALALSKGTRIIARPTPSRAPPCGQKTEFSRGSRESATRGPACRAMLACAPSSPISCARPDHTAPLADADSLRGILRDRCLEGRMCDAEIGDPAEHLDQVVALVEHVDRVAQVLDWVLALEGDLAPANDPSLFHA